MSRVVCIIQARLGSTRLPVKALIDLCGRPLIRHVVDRALQIKGVDQVVVAVPNESDALAIAGALRGLDVPVVWYPRIDENDVLARYALAATEFKADIVVRVTGDCPLLDPEISASVLRSYDWGSADYVSNVKHGYVDGTDTEVFNDGMLLEAHYTAEARDDREHVTPYMRRHCGCDGDVTPSAKTSVDSLEDFQRVEYLLSEYSI